VGDQVIHQKLPVRLAYVGLSEPLVLLERLVRDLPVATSWSSVKVTDRGPVLGGPRLSEVAEQLEEVLNSGAEAVLLFEPLPRRLELVRGFSEAGQKILTVVPLEGHMAGHLELAVRCAETGAVVVPWWPLLYDLGFRVLAERCRIWRSQGVPCYVRLEVKHPEQEAWPLRDWFVEAVALGRVLAGDFVEVTAQGDPAAGRVTAFFRSPDGSSLEIRSAPEASVGLRCEVATRPYGRWQWSRCADESQLLATGPEGEQCWDATFGPRSWLEDFTRAVRGLKPWPCTWERVLQELQAAEAAADSLLRRRSVEVVHGSVDDEARFKATMTLWGCALLWLALGAVLLVGVLEFLGIPSSFVLAAVPVVLALFLALQVLKPKGTRAR
jgi:predicted dehydrogenase